MENLNNVPNSGTYGVAINEVNHNFSLVKGAIDGLEARTIRSKGLFPTVAALNAAYPSPQVGDYAYVGSGLPAEIYDCVTAGTWHDTGQTGGSETINLGDYSTTIQMNSAIDSGLQGQVGYAVCSTAGGTARKDVVVSGFKLLANGGALHVKMTTANTASNATMNISPTSTVIAANTKPLFYNGEQATAENTWEANEILSIFYDGTRFMASNSQGGGGNAEKIKYDNSQSGLAADNVQEALDDVSATIITKEEIVVSSYEPRDYVIRKSDGCWSSSSARQRYRHIRIPVTEGETFILTASPLQVCDYAWLYDNASPSAESPAHLVSGTGVEVIVVGGTAVITAPATAQYLYIRTNVDSITPIYPTYLGIRSSVTDVLQQNFIPFLKGKKISIMGNSRCTFNGYIPSANATKYPANDVKLVNDTWWWKVINALCAELELNNSYSGGRVTTVEPAKSYITIYNSYGLGNPDVIFLWGGINDLRNNAVLGELDFNTPTESLDKTTFAGAMDYLVRTIIADHPNAYIVMFVEDCLSFNEAWVQVLYDIANHYYVPRWEVNSANKGGIIGVVDLSNLMSEAQRYDSLHYNAEGMQTIASETLKKLASMGSEDVEMRINTTSVSVLDKVAQYCCVQDILSTYTHTSGNITSSADYTRAFISYNFVKGKRYRVTVDFGTLVVSQTQNYGLYLRLSDRNDTSDPYRVRQILKLIMPLEMVTTVIDFTAEISVPYLEYQLNKVTTQGSGVLNLTIQELGQVKSAIDKSSIIEECEIIRNFDGWDANGTWQVSNVTRGFVIPIREYNAEVEITAGTSACYFAFWKEHPTRVSNGGSISCYCVGTSRMSSSANRTKNYSIPSDCKYVYIGMVNSSSTNYTPSDVKLKYVARDNVEWVEENNEGKFFPYAYKGGNINLKDYGLTGNNNGELVFLSNIGAYSNKSQQSIAIYGDYVFSFYDTGYVRIYHLPSNALLASFLMNNTISGTNNHCGNANFGSQFYADSDTFPCLYLSSHGEYKAYVIRIVPTGTDTNGFYTFDASSITLVQTITGASSWGIHFYPDGSKLLVHKNTSFDQHYYVFDIPSVSAGDISLNAANAIDEFTFNVGLTQAGAVTRNGKIFANMYSSTSGHDTKRMVFVYDYVRHSSYAMIPAPLYPMRSYEVEGIDVYEGAIWLSYNDGNFIGKIMVK